ncbi:SirB1 family protein [Aliiglaciecola litoralis]|uniref:SirB1 family protein n=1 Tax=Aliiglaciecola litoralis TaxID=582857 RepID=A0ABN1LNG6_9ALTE
MLSFRYPVPITENNIKLLEANVTALHQAIVDQNTLLAGLLVTRQFTTATDVSSYLDMIDSLAEDVKASMDMQLDESLRFKQFSRFFYTQLAFSSNENDFFDSKYCLLDKVIDYRTGIPVTLAIVFSAIAQRLGFDVTGVNFPGHFLIRYCNADKRTIFIDPLTGKILDWQELERLYLSIVGDSDDDEMPAGVLDCASTEEIVVRMLHNLKASFIREEKYQNALRAVDLLIGLSPNDPYERRDRGFLLHQLECPQVAKADYQFFIEHCPQDPSAQLLKLQMRHWDSMSRVILH